MISYDEAGRVLDEAVDSLPEEIFRDLNGGVNLIRGGRTDEYGLLVMGTYNVNQMGRYIEIYYGSFKLKYPNADPEKCKRELIHTLKHELTHHIESLAMDRSLEKWDEQHVAELLAGLEIGEEEPLEVSSILFVDGEGAGLAEMAMCMFYKAARENGIDDMRAGCASFKTGPLNIKAARAAARYDVKLVLPDKPLEVNRALCEAYDVVMCMTAEQSNTLAARWPDLDERMLCLSAEDLKEPRMDSQLGWNRIADNMLGEINMLVYELMGGGADDD